MPDLESLIAVREKSIEQTITFLNDIETALKNQSAFFYSHMEKILSEQARKNVLDANLYETFSNELEGIAFEEVLLSWINSFSTNTSAITRRNYTDLLNIKADPIIAIYDGYEDTKANYLFIRPSYVQELAVADHLQFTVVEDEGIINYEISANLPVLEVPKVFQKQK